MRDRLRSALLVGSALVSTIAAPALAQETAPAEEQPATPAAGSPSGEIIVTARRFEERLQDVPISVTVFSQDQLDNRNIVNPADLATYTPSLSANRQYGTEKSSFSIRGFVQELGTQPSVAVYFADVVAPRAQGFTSGGNGTFPGTLFDLQNVQVLKGPQGTLFGRNTTGGAVLLVPQRPTDRLEGYVEGSIGNYDLRRGQAVLNLPVADTFRVRLGIDRMKRDGYLKNRSGIGPDAFGDIDYWSARASVVADLTPNLENYIVATYNVSETNGTLGQVASCLRGTGAVLANLGCAQIDRRIARGNDFYDIENDVPNPRTWLEQWQIINTTTWDASDTLTLKNIVSYGEFREKTRANFFGDRLLLPVSPVLSLPLHLAGAEPGPSGETASQYTFTEELQLQGRSANDKLVWQAGGYFELSKPIKSATQLSDLFMVCADKASFNCIPAFGAFSSLGLQDNRTTFRDIAAYAQATYNITEQFAVTAGVRYTSDRIRSTAQNATARFVPAFGISCSKLPFRPLASFNDRDVCRESFVEKSSKPTWLIDLEYKPDPDKLIYAKYARGYRQGTINLLPLTPALNTTAPEKVDTYEVGAKASFGGAIGGNIAIAAFYNDFSDQQLQANTIARTGVFPVNIVVNAGKSTIKGIEADVSLRPFTGFRIDAAYAYLDTKLKSITLPDLSNDPNYSGLIPTAALGGPLALSPKNRLTVTGTYTLPLDESIGRVSVAATYTHTDKQFANHASDALAPLAGINLGLLPATDLLNLNLDWNEVGGLPVDLSLFATNVTKEKYWLYGGALLGSVGYDVRVLGEPRMYGARLRYRFGRE